MVDWTEPYEESSEAEGEETPEAGKDLATSVKKKKQEGLTATEEHEWLEVRV